MNIIEMIKMSALYDSAVQDAKTNKWKLIDTDGYVRWYDEKPSPRNWTKYRLGHHVAMEEFMGRPLVKGELVHHEDGNRSNNTRENLKLVTGGHLNHIREEHPNWRSGEKFMHFPHEEHDDLKARLQLGLDINTTRIEKEQGKYVEGKTYPTPFGKLYVEHIMTSENLENHPNLSELSPAQYDQIKGKKFDYLTLSKVRE